MNWLLTLVILCFPISGILAQEDLSRLEQQGQLMLNSSDSLQRSNARQLFTQQLDSLLALPVSFELDFSKVRSLSCLTSPDGAFRLFTWSIPKLDGSARCAGRLLFNPHKNLITKVLVLTDTQETLSKPGSKKLNENNWYGAVYFQMALKSYKNKNYYILLGWNGSSSLSNKKVIDVLQLGSGKNQVEFGAPIFSGGGHGHRVIFEYSKSASMSLKLTNKGNQIVFDHLAPTERSLTGFFEFYSPDFTVDSYRWKRGRYMFLKNIDAKNIDKNEGNKNKPIEKGIQAPR